MCRLDSVLLLLYLFDAAQLSMWYPLMNLALGSNNLDMVTQAYELSYSGS